MMENESVETLIKLESKEDVIRFISEEYFVFLNDCPFSERAIAKKIDVSATFLNNLRNSSKKDISPDMAVKILRLIGKESHIDQTLKILSPVCLNEFKYSESLPPKEENVQVMNEYQYVKLGKFFISKTYGKILSMIFGGLEVRIDDLESTTQHTKERIEYLKEKKLIEIDGNMIRPSELAKKIMSGKIGYFHDIEDTIEQALLFLSWINPDMLKRDKELGLAKTFLGLFYKEDIPELVEIYNEADRKAVALSKRKFGGTLIIGGGNFFTLIGKRKKEEEKLINKKPNKDFIQ